MKILLYISLISCRDCSNATSESQDLKKKNFKNSLGYGGLWRLPSCWSPTSQKGRYQYAWFTSGVDAEHGSQVVLMVHRWCCCCNTSSSLYPSGENCCLIRCERPCLAVEDKGPGQCPCSSRRVPYASPVSPSVKWK